MASTSSSSSLGISGILGVVFVTLKLTGFINWAWWLVLLPFYGLLSLCVILLLVWWGYKMIRSVRSGEYKKFKTKMQERKENVSPKSKFQQKLEEMANSKNNFRQN